MPARPQHNPGKLKARIHIAKKQLGMDDDVYRALLKNTTGKTSCGGMSLVELMQVDHAMQQKGFKPKKGKSPSSANKIDKTMVDKIRAIWISMFKSGMVEDGSEQALEKWVQRTTRRINKGIGVSKVDWLNNKDRLAHQVLESLKQWQARVRQQWLQEDMQTIRTIQKHTGGDTVEVILMLLVQKRIFYWAQYEHEGVPYDNTIEYCTNRKELNRG